MNCEAMRYQRIGHGMGRAACGAEAEYTVKYENQTTAACWACTVCMVGELGEKGIKPLVTTMPLERASAGVAVVPPPRKKRGKKEDAPRLPLDGVIKL